MIEKYCESVIPFYKGQITPFDREIEELALDVVKEYKANFDDLKVTEAIISAFKLISASNKYIDNTKPWELNAQGKKEELDLLEYMDNLNKSGIKFALSNVLTHKGRQNTHLLEWLEKNNYVVIPINNNYNNSNYHTIIEADDKTREVLVINYEVNFSHDEYKIRKGNDNNYEIYWQQRKFD